MFQVFHLFFRRMLQVLRLDVSKADRMLHLPPHFLLPRLDFSSSSQRRLGIRSPLPLFSILVAFGAVQTLCGRVKRGGKQTVSASVRILASLYMEGKNRTETSVLFVVIATMSCSTRITVACHGQFARLVALYMVWDLMARLAMSMLRQASTASN
jgi:hypothetical protein